jgi:hypothetical protein
MASAARRESDSLKWYLDYLDKEITATNIRNGRFALAIEI